MLASFTLPAGSPFSRLARADFDLLVLRYIYKCSYPLPLGYCRFVSLVFGRRQPRYHLKDRIKEIQNQLNRIDEEMKNIPLFSEGDGGDFKAKLSIEIERLEKQKVCP